MVGKATVIVIIGFAAIFGIAGQYWDRTSNSAVQNFVDYYNLTAARNLAEDAANIACDSLFVDPGDTSMNLTFYDGDNSCQISSQPRTVGSMEDCYITAISFYNDAATQISDTIQVWLQPLYMNTYAMFTQNENGVNWVTGDTVNGRFATNGKMYIDGAPVFKGRATAVGGISKGSGGNHAQFLGGFESGSSVRINIPSDLSATAAGATAASTFQPSTSYQGSNYSYDVYLDFNSDGTVTVTTKTQEYTPPARKYGTGTWSVVNTTTAVTDSLSSMTNSNGQVVILVKNGDVHVQGTVSGSVTVAALAGSGSTANISSTTQDVTGNDATFFNSSVAGNVIIEGNIEYNNPSTDMLGLVADNSIALDTQPSTGDVTIDAAMFAKNGSWTYLDYDGTANKEKMGTLNVYGSICQNLRGAVGTESGGTVRTGFLKNYTFDPRFNNAAPPCYPHAVNQYQLVSWHE